MDFKRSCVVAVGAILLATAGITNLGFAFPRPPGPVVPIPIPPPPGVVVEIPLPPPIAIPGPPEMVVVPGTNVYVAPDVEGDIVFHQGFWWRLYDGRWYRSRSYSGPWNHIAHARVPRVIFGLPPGFRHSYRENQRLHHEEVKRNWQRWEHEHHWEGHHN